MENKEDDQPKKSDKKRTIITEKLTFVDVEEGATYNQYRVERDVRGFFLYLFIFCLVIV